MLLVRTTRRRMLTAVVCTAAALTLASAYVPIANAESAGGQLVAFDDDQANDPMAVKVVGSATYVLDSGFAQNYGFGSLLMERNVHSAHPSVKRVFLPDAHGLPTDFAVDPATGDAYIAEDQADKIAVVTPAGKVSTVDLKYVAQYPDAVAVDSEANLLYIGDDNSGNVLVLNLETLHLEYKVHPQHSEAGITSLAVDTIHHEVWAGSRGGLIFLLGLGNAGVAQMGSTYAFFNPGDKDLWPTAVAMVYGPSQSVHIFAVHANTLTTMTDYQAIELFQNPDQSSEVNLVFDKNMIAGHISINAEGSNAWVTFPSSQQAVRVEIGDEVSPSVSGYHQPYADYTLSLPFHRIPNAVQAPWDSSGQVLVVGDDLNPSVSVQRGFLQIEQPPIATSGFPSD